jgi:hypothetical protein
LFSATASALAIEVPMSSELTNPGPLVAAKAVTSIQSFSRISQDLRHERPHMQDVIS